MIAPPDKDTFSMKAGKGGGGKPQTDGEAGNAACDNAAYSKPNL